MLAVSFMAEIADSLIYKYAAALAEMKWFEAQMGAKSGLPGELLLHECAAALKLGIGLQAPGYGLAYSLGDLLQVLPVLTNQGHTAVACGQDHTLKFLAMHGYRFRYELFGH